MNKTEVDAKSIGSKIFGLSLVVSVTVEIFPALRSCSNQKAPNQIQSGLPLDLLGIITD
jgi:hypothetical protein